MGDYVRTGISTMLNTGTVIGLGANIFGEGFQEKYISSFKWGKDDMTKLDQFISTAEKMMKRRGKTMNQKEKILRARSKLLSGDQRPLSRYGE